MKTINRTAILVTPRKPYIDWANSFEDGEPKYSEEEIFSTAYLIPDSYDGPNYQVWLKKNYKDIFEQELNSWVTDPGSWPEEFTFEMFMDWFEIRVADEIIDLGKNPLLTEEY